MKRKIKGADRASHGLKTLNQQGFEVPDNKNCWIGGVFGEGKAMDDYPANENADAQGQEDDIIPLSRVEQLGRSIYDLKVVGLEGPAGQVLDPGLPDDFDRTTPDLHVQRKRTILDVLKVLEVATKRGVSRQVSLETLLAVSISMFVELIGRERAANLFNKIPDKIRGGDFG